MACVVCRWSLFFFFGGTPRHETETETRWGSQGDVLTVGQHESSVRGVERIHDECEGQQLRQSEWLRKAPQFLLKS